MDESQTKLDVVDRTLARNLGWIAAADAKVSPVFAIDTAMLGVLAALLPKTELWTMPLVVVTSIATTVLLASIVFLAIATFPRLKGPKGSIVYFGGAVKLSEGDFIKRISSGASTELIADVARQAYRNAEIAAEKYTAVRRAMILMFVSVPVWLITLALLYSNKAMSITP